LLLKKELIVMKITPYDGNENLEDIESLTIVIKNVPFEEGFVPAFFIQSPSENYEMTLDELNCLMDGVEIARKSLDSIIAYMLRDLFNKEDKQKEDEE